VILFAPSKLPVVMLPLTDKLVSMPTLVILGCAFAVTVPAVVALPDILPDIFAVSIPEIITFVAFALIV